LEEESKETLKLVYVEWFDHCSFTVAQWRTKEEYDVLQPPLCKTVGWILKEDKDKMIVVQTWQESEEFDDQFVGEMCIIKGNIKVIRELND
jgi:hypothetical protein